MGFSTLFDIITATVLGGILFMIILRMDEAARENTFTFGGDYMVQNNLTYTVQLVEYDFRKIGYCADYKKIPDPSKSILYADSRSIKFLTDIYPADGNVDTLHYYLGDTSECSGTPNPRDRYLYRVINSETPVGVNLGLTQFRLRYYNTLGDPINVEPVAVPSEIYTMQIDVTVENVAAYGEMYSEAFWRQIRLAARNIRNR